MKLKNKFLLKIHIKLFVHFIFQFFDRNEKVFIHKENKFSDVAKELSDELITDITTRYNFLMDGKGEFPPNEVDNEKSVFLVAFFENEPVGCGALRPLFENYGLYKENMHSNCFEIIVKND